MTPASNELGRLLEALINLPQLVAQSQAEVRAVQDLLASPNLLERIPKLVTDDMVNAFFAPDTSDTMSPHEATRMRIAAAMSAGLLMKNQVLPSEWALRVTQNEDVFVFQMISPLGDPQNTPTEQGDYPGTITLTVPRDGSSPATFMASLHDALINPI